MEEKGGEMWGEGEERRGNVEGEKGERGGDTVERCSVAGGKSMIPSRRWRRPGRVRR